MDKLILLLWTAYLGLSPIYWLPGINPEQLYYIKLGLVSVTTTLTWSSAFFRQQLRFPSGMLGIGGFCAVLLAAGFAFYQGEPKVILKRGIDFTLGFIMLWTFYMYAANQEHALRALKLAAVIVGIAALITLTATFIGFPTWKSPTEFGRAPLSLAGFTSKRTGWSNGIALFAAPLFLIVTTFGRAHPWKSALVLLLSLAIVGSQLMVGGRAGLLTTVISLGILSFFVLPKRWLVGFSVAGLIIVIMLGATLLTHLRFDRLVGTDGGLDAFNSFSAGRINAYLVALEIFSQHPLTGLGFGNGAYGGAEIHNLWLRLLVEGGIFLPLVFGYVVLRLTLTILSNRIHSRSSRPTNLKFMDHLTAYGKVRTVLVTVIFAGIIISMFEPKALIGSFQNSAIWWAAAGTFLAMSNAPPKSEQSETEETAKPTHRPPIRFVEKIGPDNPPKAPV